MMPPITSSAINSNLELVEAQRQSTPPEPSPSLLLYSDDWSVIINVMSGLLFSLQIKLGRNVVKVPVLANDSIEQLVSRLAEVAGVSQEKRDAIGTKLNQQLRHLLE